MSELPGQGLTLSAAFEVHFLRMYVAVERLSSFYIVDMRLL